VFFVSRAGGAWTNSSQGVSSATLSNGDDAGFRYDPLAGADPPPVAPAGTCPAVQPTPTPHPTPRPTPKPTPATTTAPGLTATPTTPPPAATGPASVASSGAEPIVAAGPTATGGGTGQPSPATTTVPIADVSPAGAVSSPFVPGLVLAACVVGALLALLGVQGIRRRHQ
jgi:hypothetical protein